MRLEVKMVLVLVGVALGSAGLLGVVYGVTAPRIAEQKVIARQEALGMLMPHAERFEQDTVDGEVIYYAYSGEDRLGLVFTVAPKGYAGPIETMVGVNMDSTLSAIRIASAAEGMAETPGLGANVVQDWFRDQFKGLRPEELYLTSVEGQDGKIEAITAATISSNAVTTGVRDGVKKYLPYLYEESADEGLDDPVRDSNQTDTDQEDTGEDSEEEQQETTPEPDADT